MREGCPGAEPAWLCGRKVTVGATAAEARVEGEVREEDWVGEMVAGREEEEKAEEVKEV